ncbi:hypothetical protein Salat_0202900 [Sesamum alatum]|uniref:Uncharacterized protein n=1 Tax=Sesamum alatum TaxID=300844 RepID=A0AAE1YYL1_9LAMI|nr:hypothetical protein Salat_0202900 [Sesamum alatum]
MGAYIQNLSSQYDEGFTDPGKNTPFSPWLRHFGGNRNIIVRRRETQGTKIVTRLIRESRGSLLAQYHRGAINGLELSAFKESGLHTNVTLVGATTPCFGGNELFLIVSDGNVYLRYLDQEEWKWKDCGFPYEDYRADGNGAKAGNDEICVDMDKNCDHKVSSARPIPFSEDSIIFGGNEVHGGRLLDMVTTIGTPTSLCMANFWTPWAS